MAGSDGEAYDEAEFKQIHDAAVSNFTSDPYRPLDFRSEDGERILTFRAVLVGLLCGALINASNIYLGLKTGWAMSANLFASLIGFALLKSPRNGLQCLPFMRGSFGPRENNIVQTVATSAGGMAAVFNSAIPAMYQLNLLSTPASDFHRLAALVAIGGYLGLFIGAPLRRFFIVHAARDLSLIFPTPSATAIAIRDMHEAADDDSSITQRKMRVLTQSLSFALVLRVVSQFAIGLFWDWHPFVWYMLWNPASTTARGLESWGWYFEWTPAFIGTGMLVGLPTACSFFAGSLLAWGVIGPFLVSKSLAFGELLPGSNLVSYYSMSADFTTADHASPRYWLIWPAVACMLAVSLTEIVCQWRLIWILSKSIWSWFKQWSTPSGSKRKEGSAISDDQVGLHIWLPGLIAIVTTACLLMNSMFGMPVRETMLAVSMSFLFTILTVHATGTTDITPLTGASAATQVALASETSNRGWAPPKVQLLSLLGGTLTALGASQASDLTADFRVGFLLRTPAQTQWLAQAIGTAFSCIVAPGIYILFNSAYSCIGDGNALQCPFPAPAASAWRAIATTALSPSDSIPRSSIVSSGLGVGRGYVISSQI
ncbi:OPT superfamily oligopeptide transporter [Lecanosticta acicola]|uniref:OPT superfamily oligopeptide transporter n=1 Tax=Lecanosticta acicola TaxID=111012 RepID=A0AAI8Z7C0_9PEZI|nr:OPT superfamily oligopeptide transporter [Lecanosticta acicola]